VHRQAQFLDQPAEQPAATVVHLDRHQPGRHLDDLRGQAHAAQRVRRLKAQQPAADHHPGQPAGVPAGPGALGGLTNGVEVVDGSVDEAAGQVVAGHRRHERVGPGGQHQCVVGLHLPAGGGDRARLAVDRRHWIAEPEVDPAVVGELRAGQRKSGGLPGVHIG
jgi:hypothetical protein